MNLPNGTVADSQILVSSGVVDTEEALPGGGSVRFAFKHRVVGVSTPPVPANPRQPVVNTISGLRHELAILRRPQHASDRLPAWAVADEQRCRGTCLNVEVMPAQTPLLAHLSVTTATDTSSLLARAARGERVYLVVGPVPERWLPKRSSNGELQQLGSWAWRGTPIHGVRRSIVGFTDRTVVHRPARTVHLSNHHVVHLPGRTIHVPQPAGSLFDYASVPPQSSQALTPRDVMIGQFGTVGVVPDGVTRVRWGLFNPGQSHTVTVYPKIHGNVAVAPPTPAPPNSGPLQNEQSLASAVWYGAGGKVIASINLLPAIRKATGP